MNALLTREYDLSYRPQLGSPSFYVMDIVYRHAGPARQTSVENYRGVFVRTPAAATSGGVAETVVWRHIGHREGPGPEEIGEWQRVEWADAFTYEFNAEQDYDDYHWSYDSFPRDANWLVSWNVALLTLDAHFEFDFLRSRRHGAIDRLRRVGDSVLTPDSDRPFWLGFPPMVDVPAFTKRGLRSTFLGLARSGGEDCGVLGFAMDPSPFEMTVAGTTTEASSSFRGTMHIRLTDGSLERGEFDECVVGANEYVYPRYTIRQVDRMTWEQGGFAIDLSETNHEASEEQACSM